MNKADNKKKGYMMGKKVEESKYISHNSDRFNNVLKELDILLKKNPKSSILDVGTSPFTFILRKRYPHAKIWTLDYSSNLKTRCKENGISFFEADLNNDNLDNLKKKFEIITFLEVLEHISKDHKDVIQLLSNCLVKGGICILQTPNKYSPKAIFVSLISENVWNIFSNTEPGKEEFKHFKEHSLNELIKLINNIEGLQVISATHSMYFDEIKSAMTYRKYLLLFTPVVYINYFITRVFPCLRRGMVVIFSNTQLAEKRRSSRK